MTQDRGDGDVEYRKYSDSIERGRQSAYVIPPHEPEDYELGAVDCPPPPVTPNKTAARILVVALALGCWALLIIMAVSA